MIHHYDIAPATEPKFQTRADRRRRRFISTIVQGLRETPGVRLLGKDSATMRLLNNLTEVGVDLIIHRLLVRDEIVTLIGIPNAVWYCDKDMASISRVINSMLAQGQRVVAAPQRAIEALSSSAITSSSAFFSELMDAAFDAGSRIRWRCGMMIHHEPSGCLAVTLATGSPCQH